MGMKYRILDYQNGKILNNLTSQEVCIAIKALFPAYSQSFDVVSYNNQFVTSSFVQTEFGDWTYSPTPMAAKEE